MGLARTIGILLASGSLAIVPRGASAQQERLDITVDDPRPVASALSVLATRHGLVVTYEDPVYEFSADTRDVTEFVRGPRESQSTAPAPVLVPKGGLLQADYYVSRETGALVSPMDAVRGILEANNLNPMGGRFDVEQSGGTLHVIPTQVRDQRGRWTEQRSVLDTRVTIEPQNVNAIAALELIIQEVEKQSGVQIGLAAENVQNSLYRHTLTVKSDDEVARDVLLRTMHEVSGRLGWLLFYDPTVKYYVFNVTVTPTDTEQTLPASPPVQRAPPGSLSPAGPVVR